MPGAGGREIAPDNFHRRGRPLAKLLSAQNLGAFPKFKPGRIPSRLEPAERDVAGEFARLLRRGKRPQRLVNAPVQFRQPVCVIRDAGPDDAWFVPAWKKSDSPGGKRPGRNRGASVVQRLFHPRDLPGGHIAEKFQGQVELLRPGPAHRARRRTTAQLPLRPREAFADGFRNGDGNEQTLKRGCFFVQHKPNLTACPA